MNSVALITGASRGIGRGIALELATLGYDLVINYARNAAAAQQTAADCVAAARAAGKAIRAEVCQADIASSADRQKLIQFTKEKLARLDLLVNNAGVAPEVRADILDASEESFDRLIAINVKGPYFLTQLAANWMIEQRQDRRRACPLPAQDHHHLLRQRLRRLGESRRLLRLQSRAGDAHAPLRRAPGGARH